MPIYTKDVPGVAASDSVFVLLCPGVAVPSRARVQNYSTQQNTKDYAGESGFSSRKA